MSTSTDANAKIEPKKDAIRRRLYDAVAHAGELSLQRICKALPDIPYSTLTPRISEMYENEYFEWTGKTELVDSGNEALVLRCSSKDATIIEIAPVQFIEDFLIEVRDLAIAAKTTDIIAKCEQRLAREARKLRRAQREAGRTT